MLSRLCLHQKLVELFQCLFEVLFVVSLVLARLGGLFLCLYYGDVLMAL